MPKAETLLFLPEKGMRLSDNRKTKYHMDEREIIADVLSGKTV
jgi:hypothetical protein